MAASCTLLSHCRKWHAIFFSGSAAATAEEPIFTYKSKKPVILDKVLPEKYPVIGGEIAHFPGADIGLPNSHCDLLSYPKNQPKHCLPKA